MHNITIISGLDKVERSVYAGFFNWAKFTRLPGGPTFHSDYESCDKLSGCQPRTPRASVHEWKLKKTLV